MHKGFKCFDISTGRIYISRNVMFDEAVFPFANLHPNVGAQLRKEIIILPDSLCNPVDENCFASNVTNATNTPGLSDDTQAENSAEANSQGVISFVLVRVCDASMSVEDLVAQFQADSGAASSVDPGADTIFGPPATSASAPAPSSSLRLTRGEQDLPQLTCLSFPRLRPRLLPPPPLSRQQVLRPDLLWWIPSQADPLRLLVHLNFCLRSQWYKLHH